jgi:hypothetical protein
MLVDQRGAGRAFEDFQLYRELATDADRRSLLEIGANEPLRSLAAEVLANWARSLPEPVRPKY